MSFSKNVLVLAVVASFGLWGCAQGPAGQANAEKIKALETKIGKLEEDFKAAVAVREQLRKRLNAVDEERTHLGQQLEQMQAVVKERDELRQQLSLRTTERDNLHAQFEQFRKGIKSLLGQAEVVGGAQGQPVTSTAVVSAPGKS